MLNRIVLIGRLTRDPEIRYTQAGVAVASFTLAVDRSFKNSSGDREADFINVVAWRQLGENCANYLSKGKLAAVDGRLQIRNYETQDGQKRSVAEVVAEDVRFLSPREGGSNQGGGGSSGAGQSDPSFNDDIPIGDDDLPF